MLLNDIINIDAKLLLVLNRPSEKSADVIVVMDVNAYILHYQRVIDDCVLHYDASYT